jgi:hypothetical protein
LRAAAGAAKQRGEAAYCLPLRYSAKAQSN